MAKRSDEDQIIAARESWITAGGYEFKFRRPTMLQMSSWQFLPPEQLLQRLVVDWKLAKHQLYPGGGGDPAAFSAQAFAEWVGDRMEIVEAIMEHLNAALAEHGRAREEQRKN